MGENRKTKADILRMKRAYVRTMSVTLAAKICDCSRSTLARYRDQQGWTVKGQDKGGRTSTLITSIATRLANGWRLHMEDADLCAIVGISTGQLRGWLYNDTQVTITKRVTKAGPDGKPLKDAQGREMVVETPETIGLRALRARAWAEFEFTYMQKQAIIAERAEQEGDLATAAKTGQWMLTKRLPKKFGNDPLVQLAVNQQSNGVSISELNLTLEQKKVILAKVRERKEIEGD